MNIKSFFSSKRNLIMIFSVALLSLVASTVYLYVRYDHEKAEKAAVNDKFNRLLAEESAGLASCGHTLLADGHVNQAEKLALTILPENLDDPDRPYSADAERLLRSCALARNLSSRKVSFDDPVIGIDGSYAYSNYARYDLMNDEKELLCPSEAYSYLSPDYSNIIYQLDSTIYASNLESGEAKPIYVLHNEVIESCEFDQMGSRVLLCIRPDEFEDEDFYRALYIYDLDREELIDLETREFDADCHEHIDYAFSNDGRWMIEVSEAEDISGETYVSVETWDTTDYSWKSAWTEKGYKTYSRYHGQQDLYVMADSLMICGMNVVNGRLPLIPMPENIRKIDINRFNGDVLIATEDEDGDSKLCLYDQDGNMKGTDWMCSCRDCGFASDDVIYAADSYSAYLYDTDTFTRFMSLELNCMANEMMISSDCNDMLVNEDGEWNFYDLSSFVARGEHVVVSSDDYIVLSNGDVRSADDFELLMRVPSSEMMSLSGDYLAVIDYEKERNAVIYDLKAGEKIAEHKVGLGGYDSDDIVISASGKYLLYFNEDYHSCLMDLATGETLIEAEDIMFHGLSADETYIGGRNMEDWTGVSLRLADLEVGADGWKDGVVSHMIPMSGTGRYMFDYQDGTLMNVHTGDSVCVGIDIYTDEYGFMWPGHRFSADDKYLLLYDEDELKVYDTASLDLVFEKKYDGGISARFIEGMYLSVCCSADDPTRGEVYEVGTWQKIDEFVEVEYGETEFDLSSFGNLKGYVHKLFCHDGDRIGVWMTYYNGYGEHQYFFIWDENVGDVVFYTDIPDEYEIYLLGNGDFLLSAYDGVRKLEFPDLQTLIDQCRERHGM